MDTMQVDRFFSFYKLFWWFVYSSMLVGCLAISVIVLAHLQGVQILFVEQGEMIAGR